MPLCMAPRGTCMRAWRYACVHRAHTGMLADVRACRPACWLARMMFGVAARPACRRLKVDRMQSVFSSPPRLATSRPHLDMVRRVAEAKNALHYVNLLESRPVGVCLRSGAGARI